jgi:hypothetical protein
MANIAELKLRAAEALNDILRTPVCHDVGTQTDFAAEPEEELLSVLKKRKNELLYIVDEILRDAPSPSRKVVWEEEEKEFESPVSTDNKSVKALVDHVMEEEESEESDLESVVTEASDATATATATTDDTGVRTDVSQRRRVKLMKELARHQGVEYEQEKQLFELYKGLTADDILNRLDEKEVVETKQRVDFIPLMDLPRISTAQYNSISADGRLKYVAAVVNRVRELKVIHGTPSSMRAVAHHYNLNYDKFYDAWRKRSTKNPYLV